MTQAITKTNGGGLNAPVESKGTLETLLAGPNFQASVKDILPKHLKPERLLKMALVAASRQPLLYKCTQASVLQSLMKSAELGLDCSGTLGLGYLMPFWNSKVGERGGYECQFIPGYRGIIELAKRANNKLQIEARVVHANDSFEFEFGLNQKCVHRPTMGIDRGEITHFYCVSREPGLEPQFDVMTRMEVDAIMARSNAKDRNGNIVGPWKSDYSEMGRKTVTKRHCKYLSLSVEMQEAITLDDEQYRSGHAIATANEVSQSVGISALKDRLPQRHVEPDAIEGEIVDEPQTDTPLGNHDNVEPGSLDRPVDDDPVDEPDEPVASSDESKLANLIAAINDRKAEIGMEKYLEIANGRSAASMDTKAATAFLKELNK